MVFQVERFVLVKSDSSERVQLFERPGTAIPSFEPSMFLKPNLRVFAQAIAGRRRAQQGTKVQDAMKPLLWILAVCALTGCRLHHNFSQTMIHEPLQFHEYFKEHTERNRYRRLASGVYSSVTGVRASKRRKEGPYEEGFKDGFVEYMIAGRTVSPPLLPPRKYWNKRPEKLTGECHAQQWFAGYEHGAITARDGCYRRFVTIPVSPLACSDLCPSTAPTYANEFEVGFPDSIYEMDAVIEPEAWPVETQNAPVQAAPPIETPPAALPPANSGVQSAPPVQPRGVVKRVPRETSQLESGVHDPLTSTDTPPVVEAESLPTTSLGASSSTQSRPADLIDTENTTAGEQAAEPSIGSLPTTQLRQPLAGVSPSPVPALVAVTPDVATDTNSEPIAKAHKLDGNEVSADAVFPKERSHEDIAIAPRFKTEEHDRAERQNQGVVEVALPQDQTTRVAPAPRRFSISRSVRRSLTSAPRVTAVDLESPVLKAVSQRSNVAAPQSESSSTVGADATELPVIRFIKRVPAKTVSTARLKGRAGSTRAAMKLKPSVKAISFVADRDDAGSAEGRFVGGTYSSTRLPSVELDQSRK